MSGGIAVCSLNVHIVLHNLSTIQGAASVANRHCADKTAAWQQVWCQASLCVAALLLPKGDLVNSLCQLIQLLTVQVQNVGMLLLLASLQR